MTNSIGTDTLVNGYNYTTGGGTTPPIADAGTDWSGPVAHEIHAHVTLDARGSSDPDGFIVSWEWREGTTLLSTAEVDSVEFTQGEHLVTLTVTDNDGYTDIDQVRVIVTATAENPRLWFCFDVDGDTDVDGADVAIVGGAYGARFLSTGYQPSYGRMRDYNVDRVVNSGDLLGTLSETAASCPQLDRDIRRIYADAKECIWAELDGKFVATVPTAVPLATRSVDRGDYILHPVSGEQLSDDATESLRALRQRHAGRYDVQIVISDGLNALAITDAGHLQPFLDRVRQNLLRDGFRPAPEHLVITSGRVRAGYRLGELLFAGLAGPRAILHVIGERPGSGHHTFSVYLTAPTGEVWGTPGAVDHNLTRVIAGIATTALLPTTGADETVKILRKMVEKT